MITISNGRGKIAHFYVMEVTHRVEVAACELPTPYVLEQAVHKAITEGMHEKEHRKVRVLRENHDA